MNALVCSRFNRLGIVMNMIAMFVCGLSMPSLSTTADEPPQPATPAANSDSPATPAPVDPLFEAFQEQTYTDPAGTAHRYRVLLPLDYQTDPNRKYPVVLFLHGAGERGDDNRAQLKHVARQFARPDRQRDYPAIVIFPQCPEGKRWVEVDWGLASGKGSYQTLQTPSPAMEMALGILKSWITNGRADTSRIYIAGLSMGGYGTWFASAAHRDLFAAAVPICSGGDPDWASRYAKLPIWTFHGDADSAVPVVRTREMIAALKAANHQPEAIYTEIPGGPHDVWTAAFERDDLFQWLFSQHQ